MLKVLGYGDNVFDHYVDEKMYYPGGNAVNFAVYAKELGVDASFLGYFASDELGIRMKEILEEKGIGLTHCKACPNTCTWVCPIVIRDTDRIFLKEENTENRVPLIKYEKDMNEYLNLFDLIHVGCYAEAQDDIAHFGLKDTLLSYDFSDDKEFRIPQYYEKICEYIDFALISSTSSIEETKDLMCRMYQAGAKNVLATRGKGGQIFYNGRYYYGTIRKVDAVDTCGAGDSFVTAFLVNMLQSGYSKDSDVTDEDIQNALEAAAKYSADNCLRKGSFACGIQKNV